MLKIVEFNRHIECLQTYPPQVQLPLPETEMSTSPLWRSERKLSGFVSTAFSCLGRLLALTLSFEGNRKQLELTLFLLHQESSDRRIFSEGCLRIWGERWLRHVVLLLCGQRQKDILLSELFKTCFLLAAGP